ncbi:adenylate kinase family protein [Archaeoglobus veneficus]|uniref:Putative adenylate kinase n=1 Tax=Archaeoglobus veneficus (strain DSM 11195 / SNP6) TaxID=693661 RepID=F2KP08_ARCVS|nr:adenylate kinase family protein [Archaeoglobus veneficus]AEA46316.1 adenylate kinase [Archaeoglobus veneficus SNP6]
MIVALTGTPGVGKTTVADILRARGYRIESVNELAEKYDCVIGEEDDSKIVDIEELAEKLEFPDNELVILEGHLAHLLNPDVAIVLRCNPLILKDRLQSKGWSEEKVLENVEAELIDAILVEAMDECSEVYEIDTTDLNPEEVARVVEMILKGEGDRYRPGKIDWISVVGDRIEELMRK